MDRMIHQQGTPSEVAKATAIPLAHCACHQATINASANLSSDMYLLKLGTGM